MSTAVFVTSAGFENAWKPPAKKRGERAIARIWLPTRIAAIAAIGAYSRRMGRLLPRHASERHGPGDLLDEHLDDRALRRPRHVDDVPVELRDPVALLADVLDHELVDLALDERGLFDLRRLLHGLHRPPGAAGVALEHRDAVFLHEARVGSSAFLAQDVRLDVGLDTLLDLLRRDLALEHDPSALERARGAELPEEIRQDHVGVPPDRPDYVVEVAEDRRLSLDDDVGGRNLESLAAAERRREGFLRPCEQLVVAQGGHERRPRPGSVYGYWLNGRPRERVPGESATDATAGSATPDGTAMRRSTDGPRVRGLPSAALRRTDRRSASPRPGTW